MAATSVQKWEKRHQTKCIQGRRHLPYNDSKASTTAAVIGNFGTGIAVISTFTSITNLIISNNVTAQRLLVLQSSSITAFFTVLTTVVIQLSR